MSFDLLVILGPTASGKTKAAVELARELDGEIISADSRQVFRGMNIGTGKDLTEYGSVPYHLIDIVDPGGEFSVFDFQLRFGQAWAGIRARSRLPLLVGGTGLYLDAVLRPYRLAFVPEDPERQRALALLSTEELSQQLRRLQPKLHNTTDLLDRQRLIRALEIAEGERSSDPLPFPELHPVVFGIQWDRETLRRRITRRLRERLEQGMVQEVEGLHRRGVPLPALEAYGLEYRFLVRHLQGELDGGELFRELNSAIHQLAKRQQTWFRRMERQDTVIHWVRGDGAPAAAILQKLRSMEPPAGWVAGG